MVSSTNPMRAVAFGIIAMMSAEALATTCGFRPAFQQKDERGKEAVQVYQGDPVPALGNSRPLLFITSMKVNTDGTRISYHQDDPTGDRCSKNPGATPCAINNIRNAFSNPSLPETAFEELRKVDYPVDRIWGVLNPGVIERSKKTGKPCVSADGYLVSMTSDVAVAGGFNREGDCDQSKWIDALTVPAIVTPGGSQFQRAGITKRSIVIAFSPSAHPLVVPGIVGDSGPGKELGEATVAMNRKLNGLPDTEVPKHYSDAKKRFQAGRTAVLLFPGSEAVLARPITAQRVADGGKDALKRFGGEEKLYKCIKDEIDPKF